MIASACAAEGWSQLARCPPRCNTSPFTRDDLKAARYPCVLLFGAPGVGKGTQGKLLGQVPGFVHMASGDIFRSLDRSSELGRKFQEYSSKGLLVPDEVTVSVWKAHVQ